MIHRDLFTIRTTSERQNQVLLLILILLQNILFCSKIRTNPILCGISNHPEKLPIFPISILTYKATLVNQLLQLRIAGAGLSAGYLDQLLSLTNAWQKLQRLDLAYMKKDLRT